MVESPKTRFQLSKPDVETIAKLASNDCFLRAIDAALAQMVWESGVQNDSVVAQASYHRISGAREFVAGLFNLSKIPPPPPKPLTPSNLDWKHY